MLRYIRHPVEIPIEVRVHGTPSRRTHRTVNLNKYGMALLSDHHFEAGAIVEIRIPLVYPPFMTRARVAWCKPSNSSYELGVEFLSQDDAFSARMVEQVCHIEDYRNSVRRNEGRLLSSEEAAQEWIIKHAAEFPGAGGS